MIFLEFSWILSSGHRKKHFYEVWWVLPWINRYFLNFLWFIYLDKSSSNKDLLKAKCFDPSSLSFPHLTLSGSIFTLVQLICSRIDFGRLTFWYACCENDYFFYNLALVTYIQTYTCFHFIPMRALSLSLYIYLLLLLVPEVSIVEIIVSLRSYRLHVHSSRFLDPKFHLLTYYYYCYLKHDNTKTIYADKINNR